MTSLEKDFIKFQKSRGTSGLMLSDYMGKSVKSTYIEPTIIEERNNNMSVISVFSRLMQDNIIFIGTEISDDLANIITGQLLWLEQQNSNDITLIINSGGGSVTSGLGIIDVANYVKNDIAVNVTGLAASMAAVIACSGTRGKRMMLPHARFMIHQPRMSFGGRTLVASDIEIEADEINKMKTELYTILSENSNCSFDQVKEMSDRDKWLRAPEAIEYGFIDKIIESKKKK